MPAKMHGWGAWPVSLNGVFIMFVGVGIKNVNYSSVPDPAHAPAFLVYAGSKPQILHGMGE
jgi:hypothetical protein